MKLLEFNEQNIDEIIKLWNRCLKNDLINSETFITKILNDENFSSELALCAFENSQLVGFGYAMKRHVPYYKRGLESGKGWICMLFVAEDFRGRGIGGSICSELERRLQELGAESVVLGSYSPHYFVPGIDENAVEAVRFFTNRGYITKEKSFSMTRTLFGFSVPENIIQKRKAAEAEGYVFANYSSEHKERLFDFLDRNFSPGWHRSVEVLLAEGLGEKQLYICVAPDNSVAGFCMRGMDDNPNRFGPFGIDSKLRNRSLGAVLFCHALYELACGGIYFVFFQSTDEDGKRFYERYGLSAYRTFLHAAKQLDAIDC